jgi:hypothetical protein
LKQTYYLKKAEDKDDQQTHANLKMKIMRSKQRKLKEHLKGREIVQAQSPKTEIQAKKIGLHEDRDTGEKHGLA